MGVPSWTGLPLDDPAADAAYEALHDKYTIPVRDIVLRMRGFYFKNAQLLSTRGKAGGAKVDTQLDPAC